MPSTTSGDVMEWATRHVESLNGRTHVKKAKFVQFRSRRPLIIIPYLDYGQDPEWYHLNGNLDSQHIPCP